MNLAYTLLKALILKARAFEDSTKDPIASQKRLLLEYLERNKDTEYGRKHNFSRIRSIEDYQRLVPISDCESMRPYVERIAKGESNILIVDKTIFFGITSGTTSRPKLIPLTRYSRNKKTEVANLWAYYISRDHPRILNGKILAIISPEVEGFTEAGIPYGAESGHAYKNLPDIVKGLYALPPAVFDIADYETRYYCILRIGMAEDVTTVATLNPSTIVLLCEKIEKWNDRIIDDIEHGTLDKNLTLPEETRNSLERFLKPDPKRAEELRKILKDKKELLPKYFWPNMELIECWKGGTVKLYLKELPRYFGGVPVRDFGCLSTEARSSIPMSDEGAGGVLAINTNFYEFIRKDEIGRHEKRVLTCDQLEKGREYFLIVTTAGGLYRYNIDDIIRVNDFFNKTPVIEFIQKGLNAVSITGEKLYESHVNEAINAAAAKHKLLIEFFSASVEFSQPSRYIFLVEFNGEPSYNEKKGLLNSIEEELYRQNAEYEAIRRAQLLGAPKLKVVKKGGFEKYRMRKIEEGAHDGQFKAPELTADENFQKNFEIAEEIRMD